MFLTYTIILMELQEKNILSFDNLLPAKLRSPIVVNDIVTFDVETTSYRIVDSTISSAYCLLEVYVRMAMLLEQRNLVDEITCSRLITELLTAVDHNRASTAVDHNRALYGNRSITDNCI
ncbi:hypothetical protein M5K25_022391 [Dendrobium thyrsiflorum]|uniref:Uncharacterized protein n=1 Tax=Dendrobium thyrsiflorum TaxID=117978 RepID=A0ABD0U644_DENTH